MLESGVQDETAFFNLFRLLAAQSGCLVNVPELFITLRIRTEMDVPFQRGFFRRLAS